VSANRQAIIEMDVGFAQIRDAAIDRATAYGVRAVPKVGAKTVHRERAAREFYPYRIEKMETAGQSCRLSAASWASTDNNHAPPHERAAAH